MEGERYRLLYLHCQLIRKKEWGVQLKSVVLTFSLILLRFLLANFRSTSELTESWAKGGCSAFLKPKTKTRIAHTSTIPTGNAYCECWSSKLTSMAIQRTCQRVRDRRKWRTAIEWRRQHIRGYNSTVIGKPNAQRTRYRLNSKHSTLVEGLRITRCQAGADLRWRGCDTPLSNSSDVLFCTFTEVSV